MALRTRPSPASTPEPRPRRGGAARAATVAGVAALLGLAVAPAAFSSAPGPGTAPNTAPNAAAAAVRPAAALSVAGAPAAAGRTVALPTGETVTTRAVGGKTTYRFDQEPGTVPTAGTAVSLDLKGHHYVIPHEALPFLGKQLALDLFDVTALGDAQDAAGAAGTDARIPVHLTFAAGANPETVPGVTLTARTATGADGYLTPDSAAAFGTALRGATVDGAAPAGPILDGVTAIAPAGKATGPTVTPHYPMHLLQVNTKAPADAVGTGFYMGVVINTDDANKFDGAFYSTDGIRYAVPEGHYSVLTYASYRNADGKISDVIGGVSDFTVGPGSSVTTVTADDSISEPVAVHLPKPTKYGYATINNIRRSVADSLVNGVDMGLLTVPSAIRITPQAKPTTGEHALVLHSESAGGTPDDAYTYNLETVRDHVDGPVDLTADERTLAAVTENTYADPAATARVAMHFPAVDAETSPMGFGLPQQSVRGRVTDYLSTDQGVRWASESITDGSDLQDSVFLSHRPGERTSREWGHGPLAPGVAIPAAGGFCQACLSDGRAWIALDTADDSDRSHNGTLSTSATARFQLYRGDTQILDRAGIRGGLFTLPAGTDPLRVVYDQQLTGPGVSQSTTSHTELTFPTPAAGTAALPSDAYCQTGADTCQVLPLLTAHYRLARADLGNRVPAGPTSLGIDLRHLAYSGAGSTSPIRDARLRVSFDGGAHWQAAKTVRTGDGRYTARWKTPRSAAGGTVSIRLTAHDTAGSSIDQTVSSALTVTSPTE